MIVQKRDFRKREGRNVFFLLQAVPFFILAVLVIFLITNKDTGTYPNSIVGRHAETLGITGNVINTLGLSNMTYNSGDLLGGNLTVAFGSGDFLPLGTNFSFRLFVQYPIDYVCEDGSIYEWRDIEGLYVDPSPIDFCGDDVETHRNCTSTLYGKQCCQYGVNGAIYGNLDCLTGKVCGEECLNPSINTLQNLISKSTTPDRGNYTTAAYKNNSQPIPGITPTSGPGVGYCFNTSGPSYTPYVSVTCNDSDGEASWIKGTCVDGAGSYSDYCVYNNAFETYCKQDIIQYNCSKCSAPFCGAIKTFNEGWYANCTGEPRPHLIGYFACHDLDPSIYAPKCMMPEKMGWALMPYCSLKSVSCSGTCSDGACDIGLGNCSGWTSNAYAIPFDRLGIYTPSRGGKYNLEVRGYWNTTTISLFTTSFNVTARHKTCVNGACRYVNGFGIDDCDSSDECGCDPEWVYGSWSDCVNGYAYRNKIDVNNCSANRIENKSCQDCTSSWFCTWQQCSAGSAQQKICADAMRCNPSNISYLSDSRPCCIEGWKATSGSCANDVKIVSYQDINNCETEFLKPSTETVGCGGLLPEIFAKWYFWVIVVLVLAIVFLILFFTVFHKSRYDSEVESIASPRDLQSSRLIEREDSNLSKREEIEEKEDVEIKHRRAGRVTKKVAKKEIKEPEQKFDTVEKIKTDKLSEYPIELISYIKSAMASGVSKEEVRAKLLEVGWQEEVVDGILAEL
ncbi:MAG: hypothetical protein NTX24_04230 [Candidatus Pacearchaeota archaeon]|nr:hypothetical protein [Candidatus Pacearchaeota archaeon]